MSWLVRQARHEGRGYATEAARGARPPVRHPGLGQPAELHRRQRRLRALAVRLGAQPDPTSPSPIPNCETWRHLPVTAEVPA
ncbi:MAG: hypothetical protein R3D59_09695 [Paracoccaceae bacterium]